MVSSSSGRYYNTDDVSNVATMSQVMLNIAAASADVPADDSSITNTGNIIIS
jgi:hypothetical protein